MCGATKFSQWWQYVSGANWRQPNGPGSSLAGRENHPVVHVAYEDALAYANWRIHTRYDRCAHTFLSAICIDSCSHVLALINKS